MKFRKKLYQFILITKKDVKYRFWFVRVCDKYLKNVEGFELNITRFLFQHIHHQL